MQLTYSTTRFGVYEVLKAYLLPTDGCESIGVCTVVSMCDF